jgi:hypothetical protein
VHSDCVQLNSGKVKLALNLYTKWSEKYGTGKLRDDAGEKIKIFFSNLVISPATCLFILPIMHLSPTRCILNFVTVSNTELLNWRQTF